MLTWLGLGQVRARPTDRAASEAAPPLEATLKLDEAPTFVARGAQTRGALPITTEALEGAVYSSRGRGYAPYNEDAAFLFRDEGGGLVLGAFDQAGGLGGRVRGAASGLAAERVARALQDLTRGASDDIEASREKLTGAFEHAHQELMGRGEGEVTTAVVARVKSDGTTLLATSGDSAALRFDESGRFAEMTPLHDGEGPQGRGYLTHALGLVPEGPDSRSFAWTLEPGAVLVLCSDGLLDAGLERDAIGGMLSAAAHIEDGVNELARSVLRRMATYRAKPDNLTLVAVRRRPAP